MAEGTCSTFSERRENLNGYRLLIKWFGASLGENIVRLDGGVGHSLAGSRRFAEIAHKWQCSSAVAETILNKPGIGSLVGKREATCMA